MNDEIKTRFEDFSDYPNPPPPPDFEGELRVDMLSVGVDGDIAPDKYPKIPLWLSLWCKLKSKLFIPCQATDHCPECGELRCTEHIFHRGPHRTYKHTWDGKGNRGGCLCFVSQVTGSQ